jgi:uncharacterized protein YprB with RNaseH-like and TPR domain
MSKLKKLFFDIETSPNIGLFWKTGAKQNISPDSIIKERAIICICYKWAGEDKVYSLVWDKNQNDKKLLQDFIKIANEANEIIGHNGDNFDLPWVRTRCLFHRIPVIPDYTTLDTLKSARYRFKFNSNRLDYIAKFLGIGQKISTEYNLWKRIVLNNDPKALESMVKYCKNDVILLEKVYNELNPYILAKTHHGVAAGNGKCSCPNCASAEVRYVQTRYTATGMAKVQLKCKKCHKYHTVSKKEYES